MEIVDEKSVTLITAFITKLEQQMGFKIHTVQPDNGSEFVNVSVNVSTIDKKEIAFTCALLKMGIENAWIRSYSPWQNGKVERSHRIDG